MHHLSSTRPSPSDSISTFSAHVLLPLDHHVAKKSHSTLSQQQPQYLSVSPAPPPSPGTIHKLAHTHRLHTHTTPVNSPRRRLHFLAIKKAVEPFKLHPTSMSYIYKVFEHLKQLWMGIWQHIHAGNHHRHFPRFGKGL